jgi:hypothetical protein
MQSQSKATVRLHRGAQLVGAVLESNAVPWHPKRDIYQQCRSRVEDQHPPWLKEDEAESFSPCPNLCNIDNELKTTRLGK